MTAFSTPGPITATIQIVSGDLRIAASDRDDTIVEVTPRNAVHEADVLASEQTRVEYSDGTLNVVGAKGRGVGLLRKPGSIHVVVHVPSGSRIDAATGLGRVRGDGLLGACRIRSGAGEIRLADAASIDLVTGIGGVAADTVSGDATCVTGSGAVSIARVDGSVQIKNSNGSTSLGNVGGTVRVKASNGSVVIDRAGTDARVATANGDVRVGVVESGFVELKTALGNVEVGVLEGTAARLDLHTSFGSVVNDLEPTGRPGSGERTVVISAQTSAGDIVVRRALDTPMLAL